MIQLFKYSGPLQLLVLFLITFIVRIPLYIFNPPMLLEELHVQILTQKLLEGNFLYRDVFVGTAPISAFFYTLIGFVFGTNVLVFRIFSGLLIFFQALFFRDLCNKNDLFSEKGDMPALIYIVISSILFDFSTLSSALIASTFLLFALSRIFRHIKSETTDEELFYIGLFTGLAYLCYMPSIIYIFLVLLTFALFTRTKFRQYMLIIIGFAFPCLCVFTYFYVFNSTSELVSYFFVNFPFRNPLNADLVSILILITPLFFLILAGVLRTFSYRRYINYQIVSALIMLLWLIIAVLLFTFFLSKSTTGFLTLMPFVVYFCSNFFILAKSKKIANTVFLLFGLYYLSIFYSFLNKTDYTSFDYNFNNQYTTGSRWSIEFENRKILNLSDDINVFIDNNCATGYVDFELSEKLISNTSTYKSIGCISDQLEKDLPDIIIDDKNLMPSVFDKIPWLSGKYVKDVGLNFYERKGN